MKPVMHFPFARALSAFALLWLPVTAHADDSGAGWTETFKSKVRLMSAGKQTVDGREVLMAGIHMKMEPGWKTYWRVPGDAGLPPSFGWSESTNLDEARVLWPGPERFKDPAGTSIGYHREVVFPVALKPARAGESVKVALDFDFAICKDICAPANAKLTLDVDPAGEYEPTDGALVKRYLDQVPRKGEAGKTGPSITAMQVQLSEPDPHITVDAKFPPGAERTDLFIEGPPEVFVPLPKRVERLPDGGERYKVDLRKGGDPAGLKGKSLTITLISPGQSRETTRQLD